MLWEKIIRAKKIQDKLMALLFFSLTIFVNDQRNAGNNASAHTSPTDPLT